MTAIWGGWPHLPAEWSRAVGRRADELYEIKNALMDEEDLIECAVLPVRDVVLFPNMVTPLFIKHENSLKAIENAAQSNETMIAITQIDPSVEDPTPRDLHDVGTEIAVGRLMHIPDGSISVLTQGRRRVQVVEYVHTDPYLRVRGRPIIETIEGTNETLALMRVVLTLFEKCVQLNRSLPEEAYVYAVNIEEPAWLADLIASALNLTLTERQALLENFNPEDRLQRTSVLLGRELDVLELEDQIHNRVQSEVDRSQREFYLREQMKAIQGELGETDLWTQEIADIRERLQHLSLPEEVELRAFKEIQRLSQMPPISPEVGIIRS